jgi:hypothetical protein
MSQWQRHLDIKYIWKLAEDEEITPQELAKQVAERLEKLPVFNIVDVDEELEEIILELKDFSDCDDVTFDDFDDIMSRLYDWGDISLDDKFGGKKVCWIGTH